MRRADHVSGAGLVRVLPIAGWLPGYRRKWLRADALAGLSVWALLVPQALAYATIAGVPVQYGLYAAFAALLAYAVFGSSRQLVTGPSATVAAVTAAVIAPLAGSAALGTQKAVGYAAALAIAAGVIYVLLGLLRMGWVSNFLSKAVLAGFILGFAIGIIIDQSHKLFGVTKVDGTYAQILWGTLKEISHTSLTTMAVGAASLGALLLMRRYLRLWPRALIVMAVSIVAVGVFDLSAHGVKVTGHVPTGMFSVGTPGIGWSDTGALLIGALSVIFVGFSETLASARTMGLKHGYDISANQELTAQGAACAASGFVGGFAVDGSLSKTSVADTAGQRTQMASLINAAFVLLTILFLASVFEDLPGATLGAVVIDAMVGLISVKEMVRYFRVNRADWVFYMGAMLGILFFGIIQGILIGVVLSLLLLIARASTPSVRRLGRDPVSDAYLDVVRYPDVRQTPGMLVASIDGPLFFANANRFRDDLSRLIGETAEPVRAVVIDAEAVSQTDTDGADILVQLAGELKSSGTSLALARVEPAVLDLWQRASAIDAIGKDHVYRTVREAAAALGGREPTGQPN
jgi:SulP family sulfate permease